MINNCVSCKPGTPLPKCSVKIDGECVYYSGEFISGPDIYTGENLNSVIQKLVTNAPEAGVTSIGLAMPSAFTVSGSPVTSSGTITISGSGTTAQYIRGDGSLATFPAIPVLGATEGLSLSGTNVVLGGTYSSAITLTNTTGVSFNITSPTNFGGTFSVSNTGVFSGIAVLGTASGNTGIGVRGIGGAGTSSIGVEGQVTGTNSIGVRGQCNTTGSGVTAITAGGTSIPIDAIVGGSADATIKAGIRLTRGGLSAITGTGISLDYAATIGGVGAQDAARIACTFTSVGTTVLDFYTRSSGAINHRMRLTPEGYLGVGITAPTAVLHLQAGSTTIAPVKLTAGSLLGAATDGAMEYDGTNLYFTTAGTRKIVLIGTVSSGGIYAGDGSIISPRTVDGDGFPLTFTDMGLFRIVQGDVTTGATYDFNTGVDFLVYDADNSSNLIMDSATGLEFQYTDLSGPSTLSSLKVDGVGVSFTGISEFADNAAAITGGLTAGYLYRTGDVLKIVH